MKLITDKYTNYELEKDFKYVDNADIYDIYASKTKINLDVLNIYVNRYFPIFNEYTGTNNTILIDKLNKYIKEKYNSPLIYQAVSNMFVSNYVMTRRMHKYIDDRKNLLMFETGVNISEAILYYNTQKSKFNEVTYNIHNINYLNKIEISEIDKNYHKIKQFYNGEKININNGIDVTNLCGQYKKVISEYKGNKIDMVFFDHYKLTKKIKINVLEQLQYAIVYISLNVLKKDGCLIFHYNDYSKDYTKYVLSVLSKYFNNVLLERNPIRIGKQYYFICDGFTGSINEADNSIMEDILKEWNNVNPDGGINLSYSDGIMMKKYGINNYDGKDYNIFVTKILKNVDPVINKFVENFYGKINGYYQNIDVIHKKYFDKINDVTYEELINIIDKKAILNNKNIDSLAFQYDLPLDYNFISKLNPTVDPISAILSFTPPLIISIINYEQTKDPNNLIKISNNNLENTLLNTIKEKLNINKIGIDSREPEKWNEIVYQLNISQQVMKSIRNKYNITVTRAFVKLYEIYSELPIINDKPELQSLHICEAPGHFINATNYYIKTFYPNTKHMWYGNSLNPNNKENIKKYGTLFNDSYGFMKKYPERWLWGANDTGDITNPINIEYFKKKYEHKMNILTSDCGLGSSERFEYYAQEDWMSILNFSQIFVSLITLKIGGTGIFKFFIPFSKPLTLSMLNLLSVYFEHLNIIKPITSSPTNNEIYFVAINKKYHLTENNYNKFIDILKNFSNTIKLFETISENFIKQIYEASEMFVNAQIKQIDTIYYFYDREDVLKKENYEIRNIKEKFAEKWMYHFKFKNPDRNKLL